jgi:hypothetical protein
MTSEKLYTQLPVAWIVTTSCLVFAVALFRSYYPLRKFPGPLAAGTTRLYSVRALWSGREHVWLFDAHKRYGNKPGAFSSSHSGI